MNSIMTHCKARTGIVFWIGIFLLVWAANGSADSDDDFDEVRCEKSQIVDRKGKCKDIEENHEKNKSKDHDRDDDDKDNDGGIGGAPGTKNYIALHNSSSPQYNDNCSDCHGGIHTRQTLNPLIPDAHVAMLPFAAGETDSDKKCTWCHRSVDLVQATGSPLMLRTSLRKRVDVKLCTLCHGPTGPGKQFYQVSLSSLQLEGSELYDLTCSGCHGLLADSEVEGESAAEIQEKINENEGGMGPLGALNIDQIQAIAAALDGDTTPLPTPPTTPPPPTAGDGVTLYAQSCASCHGDLANSDQQGASAENIQAAIDNNKGGMGSLSALTTQQIQAIAAAIVQTDA
jgi:mono/diheme cytochrome c family protein